ncbi:MAG: hypothetical protein IKR72_06995 [Bacteroidales bacterium]|nr:hypothetical protein [Bacteroidales bacterium]
MANDNKVLLPSSVARSHESELESIRKKVNSEGVSAEDIVRARNIISKILDEKELGALISSIKAGNTKINGLNSAVKSSSKAVFDSVEGNILGLITPARLKTVLQAQEREQVKKGGPFYLISESIKTVNDNLGHTARIIKAVLQLQLITMSGVLKNAEVETNRAQKLARLSEKLTTSDLNLEELLDYSLELDDYASSIDLSLGSVKNEVVILKKAAERIDAALSQVKDTQQSLSKKIDDVQAGAEKKVTKGQLDEATKQLVSSIGTARTAAETKSAEQLAEAEKRLAAGISEAKAAAETKAAEQLAEAEKRLAAGIFEAKAAAETKSAEQLAEVEKKLTGSISDAQAAAETKAAEQLAEAEKSINEKILQIQQNVRESVKENSEATRGQIEKTDYSLRRRIVLSYIIGGVGIICSAVTLILSLLHVI